MNTATTHFGVHSGAAEFIFDHHDDNAEHAHDQGIVTDPLPFFEQRFPTS